MPTLAEILSQKLIPWTQQNASESFIVAHSKMSEADMPQGVQLSPRKIMGKRKSVKNQRYYGNTRGVVALWPEATLNEVNKLKLVCVLEGHLDYQLGNYRVRCEAGHFIFIPPGIPHPYGDYPHIDIEKGNSCDVIYFLLHPNALQCWVNHLKIHQEKETHSYIFLDEHLIAFGPLADGQRI